MNPRRAGHRAHALVVPAVLTVLVGFAGLGLAGCTSTPPPPLVTSPVATTPSRSVNPDEVLVGVDSLEGGYNPHQVADQSPITTALANLVLPSVFRTAPDGTPVLDRTLMISAEVTKAEPYTVMYQLRTDASWSDSAPIAAEDFVYLWEQLRDSPSAVDSAGYRLIANIAARDAGKVVEVTFDAPYPGWRSLFSGLLPAHLLKDAPGGWNNALRDNFPATGGPFAIRTLDRDRGEIVLERNDRYWAQPATLDRVVLRRAEDSEILEALSQGHHQLAMITLDSAGQSLVAGLDKAISVRTVPRPTVAALLLRPGGADLAEDPVRQALVALIDRTPLIAIGTGGGPAAKLRANAQVRPPSAPGYVATVPTGATRPNSTRAEQLLVQAGYARAGGVWSKAGRPLSVVIAAPAERDSYLRMADEVGRQLRASGIQARVVSRPGVDLFARLLAIPPGQATGDDVVDLVVAPRPVGGDPATVLATNFGCGPAPEQVTAAVPANPIGLCDSTLQPTVEAALTGAMALPDALSTVEPAVWREAVSVPLYQEADTLLVGPEMSEVSTGPPLAGPFAGAPVWRRSPG